MGDVRTWSLSPARQRLLRLMQRVRFGQIVDLVVRDCEPLLTPPPRVLRSVRLGGNTGPRNDREVEGFAVKKQVLELFDEFDRIGEGKIARLDLKDGLPTSMIVEEPLADKAQTEGTALPRGRR